MRNFVSKLFVITGFIFILSSLYLVWQRNNPDRLSFDIKPDTFKETIYKKTDINPVQIVIQDVNINLPLYPSIIDGKNWETTTKGASYLTSSPMPGEEGNSIIYAHNWNNLFGKIVLAKPGGKVKIAFSDNSTKTFTIKYTATVTPDETHILNKSNDKRITLYTCTGIFDQKRFVAVAVLD
ncbi:MAG: hypothetical protein A2857_06745 [Candidatus Levybacteria bacterium RIFCSPHIGHO2_01_FULL_36_15]|nr:MAG: hypothetical protein A2857_06745 [Candidatus Levybacteria bacterium RIFCSPHIGHO2_01_FULL_36_15]OGH37796.1 MAG: hypothetical protein A2905_00070 [Candidatus Levybacteria bacterium RIFCSPLOWO2_01_FULL_36_10]